MTRSNKWRCAKWGLLSLFACPSVGAEEPETIEPIATIDVTAPRVANQRPAATIATPVTLLRYDPRFDVQSRGVAESQADVTVRGGVFESVGFKIGAVSLFDPQTGHYAAELPFDPASLSSPALRTGIDNALSGFNSTVATVEYQLAPIADSRSVSLGLGSDSLSFGEFRLAERFGNPDDTHYAASLSYATSSGDGSRDNGDHDTERATVRVRRTSDAGVSDLVFAWQDKFFGWPGMYTGFATLPETDHSRVRLLMANHRSSGDESNWWEVSGYYRSLVDDYDFDRRSQEGGQPGSFDHETESYAVGLQGSRSAASWDWRYGAQLTGDRLVRSTDLLGGDFNDRQYLSASIAPTREWETRGGMTASYRLGATLDWSSEDGSELLPLLGFSLASYDGDVTTTYSLEYAATSQLPGYTALKSGAGGLFGGNPTLGRERADTLQFSAVRQSREGVLSAAVFRRQDDELVDWTFSSGSPFARQANAVDIDVSGVEVIWQRAFEFGSLTMGYTWLDKDADYGSQSVDASYYALNFAKHRLTSALIWQINEAVELRLDVEGRKQEDNPLRSGSDDVVMASLGVLWQPVRIEGLRVDLIADNLTNTDFQEFPGTPPPRRRFSLQASYSW